MEIGVLSPITPYQEPSRRSVVEMLDKAATPAPSRQETIREHQMFRLPALVRLTACDIRQSLLVPLH
jgi:hypothetical protein